MRKPTFVVLYIFLAFFIIGVAVHRDYGVSVDEPGLLRFGNDAFAYIFQRGPEPIDPWQFHTPLVPLVMTVATAALGYADGADIWFLRHLITFGIFFCGIVAFFCIAKRRFGDWRLPLLGAIFFMLSPRLFAHGFYNPKDIPTLTAFTISILTLLRFLEKPTLGRLAIHAVSSAILISLRVFGLMIPMFTVVHVMVSGANHEWKGDNHPHSSFAEPVLSRAEGLRMTLVYLLTLPFVLILIWPLLWTNPLHNFLGAMFSSLSRPAGELTTIASGGGVSWLYVPVWIAVTTPVLYSAFFLCGCSSLIHRRRMHPVTILAFLWFFLPIVALPLFHLGIFNEWRHVLFLYPAFLLIALEGVEWLWKLTNARWWTGALAVVIGVQLTGTGIWMFRNHPFEYAYFSMPASIVRNFERDYWGMSYRAGLEWILDRDRRKRVPVYPVGRIARATADTLPLAEWERLEFVEPLKADYILVAIIKEEDTRILPAERKLHAIAVDGREILSIYRGPDVAGIFKPHEW